MKTVNHARYAYDCYLANKKTIMRHDQIPPVNGKLKELDNKVNATKEWRDKTEIAFTSTRQTISNKNEFKLKL